MDKKIDVKVSATDLYIKVLENQIVFCNKNPTEYGILYDKGFKDGIEKSIKIILKVNEEVSKHEKTKIIEH